MPTASFTTAKYCGAELKRELDTGTDRPIRRPRQKSEVIGILKYGNFGNKKNWNQYIHILF